MIVVRKQMRIFLQHSPEHDGDDEAVPNQAEDEDEDVAEAEQHGDLQRVAVEEIVRVPHIVTLIPHHAGPIHTKMVHQGVPFLIERPAAQVEGRSGMHRGSFQGIYISHFLFTLTYSRHCKSLEVSLQNTTRGVPQGIHSAYTNCFLLSERIRMVEILHGCNSVKKKIVVQVVRWNEVKQVQQSASFLY